MKNVPPLFISLTLAVLLLVCDTDRVIPAFLHARVLPVIQAAPTSCWVWLGVLSYLALSWFVVGPMYTRREWARRQTINAEQRGELVDLVFVWFCTPVWLIVWYPAAYVHAAMVRLIFGTK